MTSEPDLQQLRAFVAVAEELHFTRAARKLNLGEQALSARIRNLETRLGVQLFERTTRKVELTHAGRTLLGHALPLLTSASRAWEEVSRVGTGDVGHISVFYAPTARHEILPRILREFRHLYPRVQVHTGEAWFTLISRVPSDIAITRSTTESDSEIRARPIHQSLLGLVLGSRHPLAAGKSIAVESLADHALEISARRFSPGFNDLIIELLRTRGFRGTVHEYENISVNFVLDDPDACEKIASCRSFGIGFENQFADLPAGLVWLPIEPTLRVPLHICWRQNAPPAVRNFISVTLDVACSEGWLSIPGAELRGEADGQPERRNCLTHESLLHSRSYGGPPLRRPGVDPMTCPPNWADLRFRRVLAAVPWAKWRGGS